MSDSKLLTVKEAADELRISADSLYRHISGGAVQTVNVGSVKRPRTRITRAALDEFIAARTSDRPARSAS